MDEVETTWAAPSWGAEDSGARLMPGSDRPGLHGHAGSRGRSGGPTLQGRLFLLVACVAAPLLLLAGGYAWRVAAADRARAEERLLDHAHTLQAAFEAEVDRDEILLRAVGGALSRARADAWQAELVAADAIARGDTLILSDQSGLVVANSAGATSAGLGPDGTVPAAASEALHSGALAVAGLERIAGLPVISIGIPIAIPMAIPGAVPGANSNPGALAPDRRFALSMIVSASHLARIAGAPGAGLQLMPGGWTASLIDRQGIMIGRNRGLEATVGTKASTELLQRIGAATEGLVRRTRLLGPGEPVTTAFARGGRSGVTATVSEPSDEVAAPLGAALAPVLVFGGLVAGLGLLLALLLGRLIRASLRGLTSDADGPALDTRVAQAVPLLGLREVSELASDLQVTQSERDLALSSLRSLFDASPAGIYIGHRDGRVLRANDTFLRIVGHTRTELEAGLLRWDEMTPAAWWPADAAALAESMTRGRCTPYDKEFQRPDGTLVPVLLACGPNGARPDETCVFVLDRTEMRAADRALAESEERFRLALDGGDLGTWDMELPSGRRTWSSRTKAFYGMTPAEEVPTPNDWRAMVAPADLERIERALRLTQGIDALYDEEYGITARDGARRILRVRGKLLRDAAGRPMRVAGVVQDVTARYAARRELAASEAEARARLAEIQSIYDNAPIGLFMIGPDMRFLRANHVLAERNGRSAADHIGRTLREIAPQIADELESRFRRAFAGENVLHAELRGETAGQPGVERSLIQSWTPQRDQDGRIVGVNVVSWELTAQRAAEARAGLATDAAGLGIWSYDQRTALVTVDERCCAVWGLPPGFTPTLEQVISGALRDDQARVRQALAAASDPAGSGVLTVEFRSYAKGRPTRWVALQGRAIFAGGACERVSGVLQDVTERHASAALLRLTETRLHLMQQSVGMGLWDWAPASNAVFWSPEQYRIYGLDPKGPPITLAAWHALILPEDLPHVTSNDRLSAVGPAALRFRIRRADGMVRDIASLAQAVTDDDGTRLVGVDVDVTGHD